ncbi:MAG: lipase family alpha/beta hydrolase [Desulfatibacillaceae bacterium]
MKAARITTIVTMAITLLIALTGAAVAGGGSPPCETKYPVVMAHGMGASASILGIVDYWWGIPEALEDEGADVYVTSVNGMDSTVNKARHFKEQLLQILAVSGAAKANIIGHSHGTIYSRYAISNLGVAGKVASHTSIAGPHRGSSVADVIMYGLPGWMQGIVGDSLDFIYGFVFGDTSPDTISNGWDLVTDYMKDTFNPNTPNMPGIYYQSWAGKIKTMAIDARNWYFVATWPILLHYEGANDGLVSVNSAKWGNFRGTEDASWYSAGCDHLNIVDQLVGFTPGFDANGFYVDMVTELKDWGY